jgi:Na+-transporting methylmalonyl-CoA/oxaloacetate decarboxylase gamma subunit
MLQGLKDGAINHAGRDSTTMTDWGLAITIACGGFGLVFMLLTLLSFSIWVTKLILDRIGSDNPEK